MRKTYGDLNLKKLRQENNLDFAHFTYKKGQCSCCYGPQDLPKRYWQNGIIKEYSDNPSYILFKNACNGSGISTSKDTIKDITYIEWGNMSEETLNNVCRDLQDQLGESYRVVIPEDKYKCIMIKYEGTI